MAVTSYIVEEHQGKGKGHTQHGNGKGLGHLKHAQDAMADGDYTIRVAGIDHDNPTAVSQTSAQTVLADGSKLNTEVRQGSITIDSVPGGGDSLHLVTDNNNGRLRTNVEFDADQRTTLGDLDELSFDYYIASSDRTNVIPVIRLIVDADGDLATTGDRGELVFEYSYQGFGATTQDAWQSADLVGGDWMAWQRSFGVNRDQIANMTVFSNWADADGYTPAGGLHFDENSLILGYSIALGSGNGTNDIYMDNFQFGGVTMDFYA
ncbi:MAG TPA: hypothetical protein VF650_13055 [Allosphingosinicella sp.]|jgi:hypothetical protein